MFSRACHRFGGFPGLTELLCLLRHLTASRKTFLRTHVRTYIHSLTNRKAVFKSRLRPKPISVYFALVFPRFFFIELSDLLQFGAAHCSKDIKATQINLKFSLTTKPTVHSTKLTELTFCSQSSRIFLICCRLFPSSSNAAGLFTDSVHLVSTGSPTFYMRKTKF